MWPYAAARWVPKSLDRDPRDHTWVFWKGVIQKPPKICLLFGDVFNGVQSYLLI